MAILPHPCQQLRIFSQSLSFLSCPSSPQTGVAWAILPQGLDLLLPPSGLTLGLKFWYTLRGHTFSACPRWEECMLCHLSYLLYSSQWQHRCRLWAEGCSVRKKVCHIQWSEYKLKNQVLWIDVGCLTDSLNQSSDYLRNEPQVVQEDT